MAWASVTVSRFFRLAFLSLSCSFLPDVDGFTFQGTIHSLFSPCTSVPKYTTVTTSKRQMTRRQSSATPIDPAGWPDRFPAKEHCSKCGLCETSFVSKVTDACAFIGEGMARMDKMEEKVHGRKRNLSNIVWSNGNNNNSNNNKKKDISGIAEEARFGVLHQPMMLAQGVGIPNAQWTGCVTAIALSMLESGTVDAVVCIANKHDDESNNNNSWAYPEPILAKTAEDVLKGRGVKPSLAPSLRVLDEIRNDKSIKKLLFCGVGCAVQAFRAIQDELELDDVYVLGTNCADNSPTPEAAQNFIQQGIMKNNNEDDDDNTYKIEGYEFMQDFKVHVKTSTSYITTPYFTLPGSIAKPSIAPSCLACFDYTNGLADVVVGYMGAPLDGTNKRMDQSYQTISVRNEKGLSMIEIAKRFSRLRIEDEPANGSGSHEKMASATVTSDSIIMDMIGGEVKEDGLPKLVAEIMAFAMRNIGPKGVNFARYSIDYHILRNYFHIQNAWGTDRTNTAVPQYAREIVDHYLSNDQSMKDLSELVIESSSSSSSSNKVKKA